MSDQDDLQDETPAKCVTLKTEAQKSFSPKRKTRHYLLTPMFHRPQNISRAAKQRCSILLNIWRYVFKPQDHFRTFITGLLMILGHLKRVARLV